MSPVSRELPDFARPPLNEVVLSVQAKPIEGLSAAHLGLFWAEIRKHFPQVQEQPALEPQTEVFGERAEQPSTPPLRLLERPETPRCWFISEDGRQLIQLQRDRLIHNWRKIEDDDDYPRYETIRKSLVGELELFQGFLRREKLATFEPNQCEVTYINHVMPSGVWEQQGQLERVFSVWSRPPGEFPPEPEDGRFGIRYIIPGDDGRPLGRLHVSVTPATRKKDGIRIFAMTITARGAPEGAGVEGALRFLDRGRELVVNTFTALTKPEMQVAWGRKNG